MSEVAGNGDKRGPDAENLANGTGGIDEFTFLCCALCSRITFSHYGAEAIAFGKNHHSNNTSDIK